MRHRSRFSPPSVHLNKNHDLISAVERLSPDNVSSYWGFNHEAEASVAAAASSPRCYHGKRQNRGLSLSARIWQERKRGTLPRALCRILIVFLRLPETKPNRLVRRPGASLDKLPHGQRGSGGEKTIWCQIMPALSPIRIEVLSPGWLWLWENVPLPPFPLLCCFPLITDLLAVEVYQAHKSKQDRGPDWERALYTGRALILPGLENKLQFRQLLACETPVCHVDVLSLIMWDNTSNSLFLITTNLLSCIERFISSSPSNSIQINCWHIVIKRYFCL